MANGNRFDPTNPISLVSRLLFGESFDPVGAGISAGQKGVKKAIGGREEQIRQVVGDLSQKGLLGFLSGQGTATAQAAPAPSPVGGDAKPEAPQMGPNLEAVNKIIETNRKQNATEAVQQLGPQGAIQAAQGLDAQQQQQQSQQQAQQFQQPQFQPATSAFGTARALPGGDIQQSGFFGNLFGQSTSDVLAQQQALNTITQGRQKITGTEPIQPLERAKATTAGAKKAQEIQNEFFGQIEKPLSTAKDVGLVERTITSLDDVNSLLGITLDESGEVQISNEGALGNVNIFNRNRQALKRSRDQFIRSALRLESGAAIGEKEEADFKDTFGFEIGFKAFGRNPEVIARSLLQLRQNFGTQRENLNPNSEARQFNSFLKSQGKSRVERKSLMGELGLLG